MYRRDEQFVDEYFNVHEKGAELGRGGQGVVFRTKDPDVAVKLALDGAGRPVTQASYVEKLRRVRTLPVPPGLHLSTPSAVLRDTAGYAMRLLNDMVPFSHFWPDPKKYAGNGSLEIPEWLTGIAPELAFNILCYRDTGGLRRRLLALYECSTILARLHGAGLVYGDVSPANAFIKGDMASREVWLIDADNLRFETVGTAPGVYTPGFGGPELVQGLDGGRPRTDCHAFAVLAFWMLTLQHPFIGDYVEQGGDHDWADDDGGNEDLDEKAYAGHVPWIHDEDDDCNSTDKGLPRPLVVTEELMRLFQETFGPGRTKFWRRPSVFHWPPALARALDQAITCPGCGMGYYSDIRDASQHCPFCDAVRPRTLEVAAYDWLGKPVERELPAWRLTDVWAPDSPDPVRLPHRLLYPFSVSEGDRDILELSREGNEFWLRSCDIGREHHLAVVYHQGGADTFCEFAGTAALPVSVLERGFWLRVAGARPRVLRCSLRGGTP